MSLREVKVPGLEIQVPKGSAFACETAPLMPKLHTLCAFVGKRGSGKGVATVNLLSRLPIDRLFVVSPSVQSNSGLMERLKPMLDKRDCFSDVNDVGVLDRIVKAVERERDDYEQYHRELKNRGGKKAPTMFSMPSDEYDFQSAAPPKHKWGGRVPPCLALYFAYILGSQLMIGNGQRAL